LQSVGQRFPVANPLELVLELVLELALKRELMQKEDKIIM